MPVLSGNHPLVYIASHPVEKTNCFCPFASVNCVLANIIWRVFLVQSLWWQPLCDRHIFFMDVLTFYGTYWISAVDPFSWWFPVLVWIIALLVKKLYQICCPVDAKDGILHPIQYVAAVCTYCCCILYRGNIQCAMYCMCPVICAQFILCDVLFC